MDVRLSKPVGRRLHPIRVPDLQELATALTNVINGRGKAETVVARGFVRLSGPGFDILVNRDDWAKIFPFIEDGTFDVQVHPPSAGFGEPLSAPTVGEINQALFDRILDTLKQLFTEDFPTSNI